MGISDIVNNIFDYLIAALFAIGAWLWKSVVGDLKELENKHDSLHEKVLSEYITKEDWRASNDRLTNAIDSMRADIKSDLAAISTKLDTKQDKQ
jgi:hypothetical protein